MENKKIETISGKVINVLEGQSGTSKAGKDWVKQEFIIETQETYPKKICIQVTKQNLIEVIGNLTPNDTITAHVNIESREYNGRWYTSISAWKIDLVGRGQATPPPIEESSTIFHSSGIDDSGLPF